MRHPADDRRPAVHEPANALDQLGRPEHFLDQNGLQPGVQSLAVLGVEAQPACGFRGTLPSAILHALVTTA
jgi:hypothetical protein